MKTKILSLACLVALTGNTWAEPQQKPNAAQLQTESRGPCSSNIVHNSGNVLIRCTVSKDVGGRALQLMNKLLRSGSVTNEKLDELLTIVDDRVPVLHGELTPGLEAGPPVIACHNMFPDEALRVYFGGNLAGATDRFPAVIVAVKGKPLISINKVSDRIAVSAQVYSSDGRVVATLRDNKFDVNPNNYFRLEHPDRHTLIVYDQANEMVLSATFLNPRAMKVLGSFPVPGRTMKITDQKVVLPGDGHIFGNCSLNVGTMLELD